MIFTGYPNLQPHIAKSDFCLCFPTATPRESLPEEICRSLCEECSPWVREDTATTHARVMSHLGPPSVISVSKVTESPQTSSSRILGYYPRKTSNRLHLFLFLKIKQLSGYDTFKGNTYKMSVKSIPFFINFPKLRPNWDKSFC